MSYVPSPVMLKDLLSGFVAKEILQLEKLENISVSSLAIDSRKAGTGSLFFALPGEKTNGAMFINQAIEQGAVAVLWQSEKEVDALPLSWHHTDKAEVPVIAVDALSQKLGKIADRFYAQPSKYIEVCGITGTNGKTSVADFIAQAISESTPCGLMGTLGKGVYPELEETGYTTPDAISCQQWLADLHSEKVHHAVMEVSSHALIQGRVNGIRFQHAVFTNLSRDHLDYHGDMTGYAAAKSRLFHFEGLANAIINVDDAAGREIAAGLPAKVNSIRYGLDKQYKPDVYADKIKMHEAGLSMRVITPWGEGELNSSLMGRFNISNLLAVLSVLVLQGADFDSALQSLQKIKSVTGRMQRFGGRQQPLVIVDFAHTPDALSQVLTTLKQHTQHELWCVFGCGGDRDKGKRPLMGEVAEQLADHIVLTNDNPRSEQPENIIDDITAGMKQAKKASIIMDRHDAIHFAISHARQGDIVLVAGKGHEDYQLIGDQRLPFSDSEEVQQQLEACAV